MIQGLLRLRASFGLLLGHAVGLVAAGCTVGPITCWADGNMSNQGFRILGPPLAAGAVNHENCAQLCSDKKMKLAGVEYGGQCMCGNTLKPGSWQKPGGCKLPCAANKTEACGGEFEIGIYSFACSGKPVPLPPAPPPPPGPNHPCAHFNERGCAELYNPCIVVGSPQSLMPFCNETLSLERRAADAIARMTLKEKIGNLDTGGAAIAALGIPAYNWWSEASTGVANELHHSATQTTKFAFPITTGMSFNRTLWQLTARQIGREARAMMNAGNGYSSFWAPVINLAREPRWGRNIETPGEDPYLTGEYAEWFTKGMQSAPEDPSHIQASACCKHYVVNSMEHTKQKDGEEHDRQHVDSLVTKQDLVDSYMYPFQACVEKGQVSGLMCSYNSVNGRPSCANDWLLDTVARKEWGFDGYITSDCDADADVFSAHHYLNHTAAQAVADILHAGTDVDCGGFVGSHAQAALDAKTISEADIDARLTMLFKVRLRLGHFDAVGPLQEITNTSICSEYAIATSMDGPRQSSALLKNVAHTLPLSSDGAGTVSVTGPNANYSEGDTGYYGPHNVCGGKYWNVVDAVAKYASKTTTAKTLSASVADCQAADTCVVAIGTTLGDASEGKDARNISLSDSQAALLTQVAAVAKKPIVVVILTAVPLDISPLMANPKVGAILHTGQPSVTVLGIAELLYGHVSPAGRTIQTIYPASYQDQISIFDFNMRPGPSAFVRPDCATQCAQNHDHMHGGSCGGCAMGTNPGRTHRFYIGKPVMPFGFGLSYTTFTYGFATPTPTRVSLDAVRDLLISTKQAGRIFPASHVLSAAPPIVKYSINVTNTGTMDADDAVLGFLKPPGAGVNGVPLQTLYAFERVHVPAGETVTVELYPSLVDFTQVNDDGEREILTGGYTFAFGVAETAEHGQGYTEAKLNTY